MTDQPLRLVYANGALIEADEAGVSIFDRGFLYGDGLFETLRARSGVAVSLERHLERLYDSAVAIGIFNAGAVSEFVEPTSDLIEKILASSYSVQPDTRLRIVLTRGIGEPGPRPVKSGTANLYITFDPIAADQLEKSQRGLKAVTASFARNQHSPLVQHKSMNYGENVLALQEAKRAGADEALFKNLDGRYCEGATTNLFIVKDGVLITPPLAEGLLPGIMRARIIELTAELSTDLSEEPIDQDSFDQASEAFLTNSVISIAALIEIDKKELSSGQAGPITKQLQAALE